MRRANEITFFSVTPHAVRKWRAVARRAVQHWPVLIACLRRWLRGFGFSLLFSTWQRLRAQESNIRESTINQQKSKTIAIFFSENRAFNTKRKKLVGQFNSFSHGLEMSIRKALENFDKFNVEKFFRSQSDIRTNVIFQNIDQFGASSIGCSYYY